MKTIVALWLALSLGIWAESAQAQIRVGTTIGVDVEILEKVKEVAEKRGLKIEIVEFSDYVRPNLALADGDVDLNSFQHQPYLDNFKDEHQVDMVSIGTTYISPLGYFSKKIELLTELKEGDTLAIPNDPTNSGRALLLLQKAGLIKIDPQAGLTATTVDIVENPLKLKIVAVDAAQTPRALEDVAAAAINNTFAIPVGLNPLEDAILLENWESPYVNIIVARAEDKNNYQYQQFVEAYQSPEVAEFILTHFKGAMLPAFKYEEPAEK